MQINTPKKCLLNYFLRIFFAKKNLSETRQKKENSYVILISKQSPKSDIWNFSNIL